MSTATATHHLHQQTGNGVQSSSSSSSHPAVTHNIPTISPQLASDPSKKSYEAIIVGAGVLGSVLSVSLARSGRRVLVVERDLTPPHSRIVGELLQPGGCASLDKLGLLDCLEGIDAVPCKGYMVIHQEMGQVRIPYPTNDKRLHNAPEPMLEAWNSTPTHEGRSFHHGAFVGSLRQKLANQPNLDVLEGTVNDLIEVGTIGNKVIGVRVTPKARKEADWEGLDSTTTKQEKIEVYAPLTIVADGYASKFRKVVNSTVPPPITRSYFVGLELENCDLPAPHHGHVLLPSHAPSSNSNDDSSAPTVGPILLYALSPTTTRMLIDISSSKTPTKPYLREHITSLLPSSVQPSFLQAISDDNPQKVKSMPNSFLPPSVQGQSRSKEGVLLAGDAMNMRHPLTGGGMSVAFNDAVLLTELLGGPGPIPTSFDETQLQGGRSPADSEEIAGDGSITPLSTISSSSTSASSLYKDSGDVCDLHDWWEVRSRLEEWHWKRKGTATCVNVLAMALYTLFGANDENLNVLRRGCFKYFLLGGECINGPVSLLSALNPSPPLLLYHFFSVALYSIYLLFTEPRSTPASIAAGRKPSPPSVLEWPALFIRSIIVFYTACTVILPILWSEVDF